MAVPHLSLLCGMLHTIFTMEGVALRHLNSLDYIRVWKGFQIIILPSPRPLQSMFSGACMEVQPALNPMLVLGSLLTCPLSSGHGSPAGFPQSQDGPDGRAGSINTPVSLPKGV